MSKFAMQRARTNKQTAHSATTRHATTRHATARRATTRRAPQHSRRQSSSYRRDPGGKRVLVVIIVLVTVALLVCGCAFFMKSCDTVPRIAKSTVPQNSYDWSRLKSSGDIKSYTAPDGTRAKLGVDVSSHNGAIDWAEVADEGIEFAYVRVGYRGYTEGAIQDDEYAHDNISGAMSNGIDAAVYIFSQAITRAEAKEEADYACDFVDSYGIGDYPVVFDMEENNVKNERIEGLSTADKTAIALAFCDEVEKRGYTPMIYGNNYWLNGEFDLSTIIERCDLWLAEYDTHPEVTYRFRMWQYTETAEISGIDGFCDLNLMF